MQFYPNSDTPSRAGVDDLVKCGALKIVYVGPTPIAPRPEAIRPGLISD